ISSSSTQTRSNTLIAKNAVVENLFDGFDDNDNNFHDLNYSRLATTITSMHNMQLQMFATIQEMQTKIKEL
ncbi:22436_t:CDS:2, partial [Gigaspora rosea]